MRFLAKAQFVSTSALLFIIFIFSLSEIHAQETPEELKSFKIEISKEDSNIVMSCTEGCAWLESTYPDDESYQALDAFGMTTLNEERVKSQDLSDLLFLLIRTEDGVNIMSISGTAWTDLSLSLDSDQSFTFDQYGITD